MKTTTPVGLMLLTALTMTAFAANSLLNRLALADGAIGPGGFAAIRLASGAIVLAALLAWRCRGVPGVGRPNPLSVAGLAAYMLGFSYAYVVLDAGLGALILFAVVQITMFLGAVAGHERIPPRRWLGSVIALGGLVLLLWPGAIDAPPPLGVALMGLAAVGWGIYSLIGRGVTDPLAATASNFTYALPIAVVLVVLLPDGAPVTGRGAWIAVLSGGVASGLGYALWYSLLPRLGASAGAVAQLTVPVIAMAGGALLLAEPVTLRALLAAGLVLGGVALGVWRPPMRAH